MGGEKKQNSKLTKSSSSSSSSSSSFEKNITKNGKGKVTAIQVAYIVDRYLSDNNFLTTRSSFRNEASHLLTKLPVHKAPKSLLSLGDMLDEYICLKEQKVFFTQGKNRLDQDKFRVQKLLTGMQDVMNTYNLNQPNYNININNSIPPSAAASANFAVYNNAPAVTSTSRCSMSLSSELTTPITRSQSCLKRKKNSSGANPIGSKRTRSQPSTNPSVTNPRPITVLPTTSSNNNQQTPLQITPILGSSSSSVAKCLFNPGPETPSPSLDHQTPPQNFTSTNRTVIATLETIQVSPTKQVSYYYSLESNHCISSPTKTMTDTNRFITRDHVKGRRLDFDGGSGMESVNLEMLTSSDENSGSPSEDDVAFDFDLPNLDCLGSDFNLTNLLSDFDDLDGDRLNDVHQF